jgi:hypothetical protein
MQFNLQLTEILRFDTKLLDILGTNHNIVLKFDNMLYYYHNGFSGPYPLFCKTYRILDVTAFRRLILSPSSSKKRETPV